MNRDLFLALLLVVIVAGAGWWLYSQTRPAPAAVPLPSTEAPATAPSALPTEPVYRVPTINDPAYLVDLPALDDSDAYFQIELRNLFGVTLDRLLVESGGVERFVATIDNLPRKTVSESIRPLKPVAGSLLVVDGAISSENADRYAPYVTLFTQSDTQQLIGAYRRFYPLMQEAYQRLGDPDAYFNDRVVAVIDHLLETPDIDAPIAVTRPHVLYDFVDPSLQALSAGQKILVRIGSPHRQAVKSRLRELRDRLTRFDD
ncbi:MAG: DUF3014 domain-containing protein [Pseudomonadota bacterium]